MKVYLYFDTTAINKKGMYEGEVKNVNLLLLTPDNLNSTGISHYRNVTKRYGSPIDMTNNMIVDQNWIDVNMFLVSLKRENVYEIYSDLLFLLKKIIGDLIQKSIYGPELKEAIMDMYYGIEEAIKNHQTL